MQMDYKLKIRQQKIVIQGVGIYFNLLPICCRLACLHKTCFKKASSSNRMGSERNDKVRVIEN